MAYRGDRSLSLVLTCGLALGGAALSAHAQCPGEWVPGTANSDMNALVRWLKVWDPDGNGPMSPVLAASGDFTMAGTAAANRIATWDGTNWTALGSGLDSGGYCLASTSSNNNLFVAGAGFTMAGGNPAKRIARWDGSTWFDLATGSGNVPSLALLTVIDLNADTIVVTGAFTSVAGVPANRIAAWSPTNGWSALGSGMSSTTSATAVMPNGDLIAGGAALTTGDGGTTINRIARWDGTTWHPLSDGVNGLVRCLLPLPNGDLLVGGAFTIAGTTPANYIARWDGTTWHALGGGFGGVPSSIATPDVFALARMPNGDIIAGGDFTLAEGNPASRIARWNGTSWSEIGSGLTSPTGSSVVRTLAVLPNGDLAAGGDFTLAGSTPVLRFALWRQPATCCVADVDDGTGSGTPDGGVTIDDLLYYLTIFESGVIAADVDDGTGTGTPDGGVTIDDLLYYLVRFEAGC